MDPAPRPCCSAWCALVLRLLYRVEVDGLEHAQAALPHAVIAANHTSFLDGILLGAFLPGEPIFAVDTQIARKWWARPLTLLVNALPVDPTNPLSIRSMIRAVEAGSACVIFPEGRITTTGALMKVYEGPAVIAERTGAALVPVRIEGAEYSPFSRLRRQGPAALVPEDPDPHPAGRAPRRARGRGRPQAPRGPAPARWPTRWCARSFATAPIDTTLSDALLEARRIHGGGHPIVDDLEFAPLSYDRLVTACLALGRAPRRADDAAASASASCCRRRARRWSRFFGLLFHRRVPAMLNFSTGAASAEAACTAAEISADRHGASLRREGQARRPGRRRSSAKATIVYLEDVKQRDRPGPEADAPCSRRAA